MTKQTQTPLRTDDPTERLLQDLIAECHAMLQEQVRPSFDTGEDLHDRSACVTAAIGLAETGAKLADAIARLRGGQAPELRQRITVERIQRLSDTRGEGG
jgi:hypothetical protein